MLNEAIVDIIPDANLKLSYIWELSSPLKDFILSPVYLRTIVLQVIHRVETYVKETINISHITYI